MSQLRAYFVIILLAGLFSCGNEPSGSDAFQSTATDGKISNADLIRNPVSADGLVDTVNVAKLTFAETAYHFGTVTSGEVVEKDFSFTNTGAVPLLITDARSTCGCTVPNWPKGQIAPGESGVISVSFDTKNKEGNQSKPVTIVANTYPVSTELRMIGRVNEK